MGLLDKVRDQFRRKIKATPKLMAYTAAGLTAQHIAALEKGGFLPETSQADEVVMELFRAYFCLVSLHVARYLQQSAALNRYGAAMLDSLREYQGDGSELVRHAFEEATALDDAIACYVQGRPSEVDRQAIEDHRRLLSLSEDSPLHLFAGKLHLRTMRMLGIGKQNKAFLQAWFVTSAQLVAAASEVLKNVVPTLEE